MYISFLDLDITVMRLCNLSWVLHTGTVSGCTDVFSILLYQRYLVRTFVLICLSGCWVGFFFILLPSKIKEELIWCMKGMLVLNQLFVIFSRPVWGRKWIELTAADWVPVCFSSAFSVSELWSSSSHWKKKDNTCVIELGFLALLVKGRRRTGHFCL